MDLLLTTELPVAEAAGFTDASHLRRDLLRHCQTMPTALRRGHMI